jgi:hypothetical protein
MAEAKRKLVKRQIGDILKIELGDGTHTYARVLPEAGFAIYDARTSGKVNEGHKPRRGERRSAPQTPPPDFHMLAQQ